jgi:FemAB-related protein (PEP-CTERM system-associated)
MHVLIHTGDELRTVLGRATAFLRSRAPIRPAQWPAWLLALRDGLGHQPYLLEAQDEAGQTRGLLALAFVKSWLFGRRLVSLPYLNSGGVAAQEEAAAQALLEEACRLADKLDADNLELRHEQPCDHPQLTHSRTDKVLMRLRLPPSREQLWKEIGPKVRNQVRKAEKLDLTCRWGGVELLDQFYSVLACNMRDLGTPVYGRRLFEAVFQHLGDRAELCVVQGEKDLSLAGALLVHGDESTEVPSASSLRQYNHTCANMLLYWNLLGRAVDRGQKEFDFGRSSKDSGTYRFKEQWGAVPHPSCWQYYVRRGDPTSLRPDHPRYQRRVRLWQKLPVWLTKLLGPPIVRGIP